MTEPGRVEDGNILIRLSPIRRMGSGLLVPLHHLLAAPTGLMWIGSDPNCTLTVPDLEPYQYVIRRLSDRSVAIQDSAGGGIRYQPPGHVHPQISNSVTVPVGSRVTVARYEIDVLAPF
ncbi:hypothetical protein FAIPA1_310053 [Frankia sp. AiPs1]|uniref:hypothetical protein n=1 Tax=Frankia sp. AiPa1 TaxID=573492 RepID=UPI00202AD155|nr:hypothetical protein [Frankia sp. AiPa1]MCL9759215.1 hypothetical protein [Frankia sp. AiPa1]